MGVHIIIMTITYFLLKESKKVYHIWNFYLKVYKNSISPYIRHFNDVSDCPNILVGMCAIIYTDTPMINIRLFYIAWFGQIDWIAHAPVGNYLYLNPI